MPALHFFHRRTHVISRRWVAAAIPRPRVGITLRRAAVAVRALLLLLGNPIIIVVIVNQWWSNCNEELISFWCKTASQRWCICHWEFQHPISIVSLSGWMQHCNFSWPVAVGHHNSRTQQSSWDGIDLIILPQQLPFHENDGARNIHIVSRVGSHVVCWVTILWFGWWFSLWSHRWFILLPTGSNLLTAGSEKETATFNLLIVWFIALSEYALKLRIGRRLWELVCRHLLERGVDYKLDSRSRRKEENSNERRGICINTAPANRRSRIKMRTRELSSTIKVDCFE